MSTIHFEATLFTINSWTILRLPENASAKLPSRGMTMVSGTINKLNKGMRRPCCFNRNLCSEPYVSHNWVLLEPMQMTEKL